MRPFPAKVDFTRYIVKGFPCLNPPGQFVTEDTASSASYIV